ncbi:unnamed protein product [Lactuca saligna]|uniref:Uncharacterized protein n=1 Tax=Lactuca saligna TaxID=75948 RepID=A0AA35VQ92_LACSI|nr:unnamed protein product [Lactuca saligna]
MENLNPQRFAETNLLIWDRTLGLPLERSRRSLGLPATPNAIIEEDPIMWIGLEIKALLQNVGKSFCPNYVDWFGFEAADIPPRSADKSVVSKFLQTNPSDHTTFKLKEMVRLMKEKRFPAAFKCYYNFHKINSISSDNLHYKMVIHVHSDSTFRRYQKEMRFKPDLWPLYRVMTYDTAANFLDSQRVVDSFQRRQMKIWNTSLGKQRQLSKMLDEWAVYIRRKYGNKQLSSSIYLSEAEPFLEQYVPNEEVWSQVLGWHIHLTIQNKTTIELKLCRSISYAAVAPHADQTSRRKLAPF